MLEITPDDIAKLDDDDLRSVVGRLCEADLRARGLPASGVTWGGNQNARDGGIDVRVSLPNGSPSTAFVPRSNVGYQVKKPDMPPANIEPEMCPGGVIRPAIEKLADQGGAYIIVSSGANTSDTALADRRDAMRQAAGSLPTAANLLLDFYDRSRVATWVRDHPGLIPWVRQKVGRSIRGWRSYEAWAHSPEGVNDTYLTDDKARLHGTRRDGKGMPIAEGIQRIRDVLRNPRGVARLAGLSGVGKTRLVQALFDGRVGESSLDPSLAIYTDMGDSPDPQPAGMASDLIASRMRIILVVDNCSRDLHRRLSELCRQPESRVSVITVEYDIQEDVPEGTDVFLLEPSSDALVEQLLKNRFKNISLVDAQRIARSSGGNPRVAFAIARTVGENETVASLSDEELFERLFYQGKTRDEGLLLAGQACALVYSFDGETFAGEKAELPKLAALVGMTPQELFRRVAELKRRDLVQQRGVWRAVLPHAIANKLAKLALQNFPMPVVEAAVDTERLLKSFAHRLSFMHDSAEARVVATRWLAPGGLLGNVANLNELGRAMFEYIAPVVPEAVLEALERAIGQDSGSIPLDKWQWDHAAKLLRSIAYDAEHFERCAKLLIVLAEAEFADPKSNRHIGDLFKSLFTIHLSGTHAPIEARVRVTETLLHSDQAPRRALGMNALHELLHTGHFSSSRSFEFGARQRDFGYWPKTGAEVLHWFRATLALAEPLACSDAPMTTAVRSLLAKKFRGLWRVGGLEDDLERIARAIASKSYWQEGWIGVCRTLGQHGKDMPADKKARLEAIEALLRPKDIVEQTRAVVLTEAWGPLDYAKVGEEPSDDVDEGVRKEMSRMQRAAELAQELGRGIGTDAEAFEKLLPELVRGRGARLTQFGQGLGTTEGDREERWHRLVEALAEVPEDQRNVGVLIGFLSGLHRVDAGLCTTLLDAAVTDAVLGEWFPALQTSVVLDANGVRRLLQSLHIGRAPMWQYRSLSGGRTTDPLQGADFRDLVSAIARKEGGFSVACDILSMRIHSDNDAKRPVSPEIIETGRALLTNIKFTKNDNMEDYRLHQIVRACLRGPEGAPVVARVVEKLNDARADYSIYSFDYDQLIKGLFETQPRAALDAFFRRR